jgi:hypothetical protein
VRQSERTVLDVLALRLRIPGCESPIERKTKKGERSARHYPLPTHMDTLRYVLGIPSLRPKKWLSFLRIWGSVYHPRYDFKTMIHVLEAATALQVFQHGRIPPRTTEVRTGLRRVFLRTFTLVKACQQTALRAGCLRRGVREMRGYSLDSCRPRETSAILYTADIDAKLVCVQYQETVGGEAVGEGVQRERRKQVRL